MHPVAANLYIVIFRGFLQGGAPIWREPADIKRQRCSAGVQSRIWHRSSDVRCTVNTSGQVQAVVPHGISTDSRNVLRQGPIDDGSSGWRWRRTTVEKGEAPGRSTVPKIFHGGIVIERDSIHEVFLEELRGIGIPDVGVVPDEMGVLVVVSHLHKAADML